MTSHNDVARRITHKPTNDAMGRSLKGSNMSYVPPVNDKPAALKGYGWAFYALRVDDTVILDASWDGYSTSTTQHMGIIRSAVARSDFVNLVEVAFSYGTRGWTGRSGLTANTRPTTDKLLRRLEEEHGWSRGELPRLGKVRYRPDNVCKT